MVIMSEFSADPAGQGQQKPLRVGFYDIERTLGKGNFAVVKLARHRVTKTQASGGGRASPLGPGRPQRWRVAIKIIDKTRLDSSNLEKIYREVQLMKLLNHPHIIKLYQAALARLLCGFMLSDGLCAEQPTAADLAQLASHSFVDPVSKASGNEVMETKDMLYIVTEFAKNGEMFDYLTSNGHLSENEARRKFWQILSAVEYCHDHHIVHRDLKTENLLLDGNMDIKLADFGFGNFYKSGEPLSTWCGSPPYAAPEVFEGKEYEGPQLDIWSLGVVLYVLVCGSLPFDGPNLPTLRQRVLEGRFRIPFFMSQDCESLIRRMLVVDPARRITIAQIRQHRWMRAEPCLPEPCLLRPTCTAFSAHSYSSNLGDYDEQALGIMQTLGVDRQRTVESLQNSSYNHFAAIYYLLLERLKEYRNAQCARPGPARQPRPRSSDLSGLEVPQEGLSTDLFRPALLFPQPQALAQSVLQAEMDCELQSSLQWVSAQSGHAEGSPQPGHGALGVCARLSRSPESHWLVSPIQPLFFPVDASCSGVLWPRPLSPSSLLDTAISEEVRQGPGLEEEQDAQESLPGSTGRRHTLAEVSTRLSPLTAPCIVVSPSATASPAEGTSSDSCLTFSTSRGPAELSGTPATQGLLGTGSPLRLASPFLGSQSVTPVLQAQGCLGGAVLLPVSFQEGRRASDTSLTQGLKAFRQQLRKTTRTKGFLGLNKIKGLARQVCQAPASRASRGGLSPFHAPAQSPGLHSGAAGSREGRSLLEEVLEQQRLLQLQHHPAATPSCPQAPQPAPTPFAIAPCDGPGATLLPSTVFTSGLPLLPPPLLQAGVSPVASAAQLLDTQLHIGAGPTALPAVPPPHPARLAPGCEPLGLLQGDFEMEDLSPRPLGTFVLVQ
ncbi:Serine/threonine-protein kinase SIK1 [Plecturocebus cupreus]